MKTLMNKFHRLGYAIADIFDLRKILRIIFYILLCVLIFIVASARQGVKDRVKYEALLSEQAIAMTEEHELEIANLRKQYEYGGDINTIESEAEYIAKVLYGTARNHSTDGQRAVVWCILNRVDHQSYPNTVAEVCEQPSQWMGYDASNPIVEDLYDLSLEILKSWYNQGHRPVSKDFIFMSWSSSEIILRDTFEEKPGTHYWRIG